MKLSDQINTLFEKIAKIVNNCKIATFLWKDSEWHYDIIAIPTEYPTV